MAHNVNKLGSERATQVIGEKVWQGEVEWRDRRELSKYSQQPSIISSRRGQGGKKDAQGNAARNNGRKHNGKKYGPPQ